MEATRILVVEDESLIAQGIKSSLAHMGYDVTGMAASGNEALSMLEADSPDLVLMDIILKGDMDGIRTAEHVRNRFNIPVIYLTACADDRVLSRAKHSDPFGYIIKPYQDDELHLSIEMALYKHNVEEELKHSREQFRSLLESAGAIPWELDPETETFTYMGPQATTVLGISPSGLKSFSDFLSRIPEQHNARVRDFYIRTYEVAESVEIEYPFKSGSDSVVWLRDTSTFTKTDKGVQSLRGFMLDITRRKLAELQREQYITELQEALDKIKKLHGMLPICAWCKKIRDDKGYWKQVEIYIEEHSGAEFTHSMCPECKGKMEGEIKNMLDEKEGKKEKD